MECLPCPPNWKIISCNLNNYLSHNPCQNHKSEGGGRDFPPGRHWGSQMPTPPRILRDDAILEPVQDVAWCLELWNVRVSRMTHLQIPQQLRRSTLEVPRGIGARTHSSSRRHATNISGFVHILTPYYVVSLTPPPPVGYHTRRRPCPGIEVPGWRGGGGC